MDLNLFRVVEAPRPAHPGPHKVMYQIEVLFSNEWRTIASFVEREHAERAIRANNAMIETAFSNHEEL